MKVCAHRGFSGAYPENTMLAFQKAVEAGCDEIELDVQLTRDGRVVILHDEMLDRTTDGTGFVGDYDYQQLQAFAANNGYDRDVVGVNRIPSFEEYCAWVKGRSITTNIEIKTGVYYFEQLERRTMELVRQYGLQERVIYSSFNHVSLLQCRKIDPAARCGALISKQGLGNVGYYCRTNGFDYYHPHRLSMDDALVQNCRQYGIEINVWTVDEPQEIERMYRWGCRSVISNVPDVCRKWLQEHAE